MRFFNAGPAIECNGGPRRFIAVCASVAVRAGTVPGSIVERLASPIPTAQRCLHILASSCCPWQKLAVLQEKSLLQSRARVSAHTKTDSAAIPPWPLVGDLQSRAAAVQFPVLPLLLLLASPVQPFNTIVTRA